MVVVSYIVYYFQRSLDQHPILKYFISTTKCMCHHTLSETKNDYPQLYVKKVRFCHQKNFWAKFMRQTFGCRAFWILELRLGNMECITINSFHSNLARSWQSCSCISYTGQDGVWLGLSLKNLRYRLLIPAFSWDGRQSGNRVSIYTLYIPCRFGGQKVIKKIQTQERRDSGFFCVCFFFFNSKNLFSLVRKASPLLLGIT